MLWFRVADAYLRTLAPHDYTGARFALHGLQHKFSGAGKDVGGHQLSPRIRDVEDLATHAALTVIEDNGGLLHHSLSSVAAALDFLLVGYTCLIGYPHWSGSLRLD